MTDDDHHVTSLIFLQEAGVFIGCLDYRQEAQSLEGRSRDNTVRGEIDAYETYFLTIYLTDFIGFEYSLGSRAVEYIVGRERGGVKCAVMCGHLIETVVEFMVSENLQVVAHHVHERILDIPLEELEIERTLHDIPGIDKHHILLGGAYGIDQSLTLEYSPITFGIRVDG